MFYYLQEMLMIRGVIAQTVLVVNLVISFYAFFKVNIYYRIGPYLKWLNAMLFILTIYALIPIIGGWTIGGYFPNMSWITYLSFQRIYMSVLPIYAFYFFVITKRIKNEDLTIIFFSLLIFSILMYFQNYNNLSEKYGKEEVTNNAGFFFIPLIPLLHLVKLKDSIRFMLLGAIVAFIVVAMKRGAILAGGVMMVLFAIHHFKQLTKTFVFYNVLYCFFFLVFVWLFVSHFYSFSDYFQLRVEQTLAGNSSGRDSIFSYYWTYFIERTSALEFLIGNGANATRVMFGHYAHNDWLEFAIDYGILGVMIYLIYWIVYIWEWVHYKGPKECRRVWGDIIVAYFLIALYSMSFDGMPMAATLCIGYCLAMNKKTSNYKIHVH